MQYSHREALKITIEKFELAQAEMSRKTEELEKQGKGKKVAKDQLNRYLKGKHDLHSERHDTLTRTLDDVAYAFYIALLSIRGRDA